MNETKFTPGPWMPPASHKDLTVWATKNDRTEMIASASTNQWCKEDEANANAKLIAAAPDLLEALRLALPYIEGAYECAFPDSDENNNVLEAAKAAIAKATT
jgi:hypothetical protein